LSAQNVAAQYMMAIAKNNSFQVKVDALDDGKVVLSAASS